MSGLVPEASSLYSRVSNPVRSPQPKSAGQDDGAFAALMDNQAEPAPAPAPKLSQKADRPAARDRDVSDPVEPATEADTTDRAEPSEPLAAEVRTDGSTDTGVGVGADAESGTRVALEQPFIEAIPNGEAAAPTDNAPADPVAAAAPAVVVDPNAVVSGRVGG